MPFLNTQKELIAILGFTIAGSGGGGTWGSITGILSDQTDLQAVLDTKQNKVINIVSSELDMLALTGLVQYDFVLRNDNIDNIRLFQLRGTDATILNNWIEINRTAVIQPAENQREIWIDLISGTQYPENPSFLQPYNEIRQDILDVSLLSTDGLVIHLGQGIFDFTGININTIGAGGLTIKSIGSRQDTKVINLNIQATTGSVILQDVIVENITSNINTTLISCTLEGTFTATTNDQTIFFNNTDYNNWNYGAFTLARTAGKTGTIDVGTSSRGYNIGIRDILTFNTNVRRYYNAPTDPASISNILANDIFYINLGAGLGLWAGQDGVFAKANIDNPTLITDWTFTPQAVNTYFYSTEQRLYYYSETLGSAIQIDLPWIIDGKLADTGQEGLMSRSYHDEVTNVNSGRTASDTNIGDPNTPAGNLVTIPEVVITNLVDGLNNIIPSVSFVRSFTIRPVDVNFVIYLNNQNCLVYLPDFTTATGEDLLLADNKIITIAYGEIEGDEKYATIIPQGLMVGTNTPTAPVQIRLSGAVNKIANYTLAKGTSVTLKWSDGRKTWEGYNI